MLGQIGTSATTGESAMVIMEKMTDLEMVRSSVTLRVMFI